MRLLLLALAFLPIAPVYGRMGASRAAAIGMLLIRRILMLGLFAFDLPPMCSVLESLMSEVEVVAIV